MSWMEICAWVALALMLAWLHFVLGGEEPEHPLLAMASGVVGALMGGYLIPALHLPRLAVGALGLSSLIAAGVFAEAGILWAWSMRGGEGPRPLSP